MQMTIEDYIELIKSIETRGAELFKHGVYMHIPIVEVGSFHHFSSAWEKLIIGTRERHGLYEHDLDEIAAWIMDGQRAYDCAVDVVFTEDDDGTLAMIPNAVRKLKEAGFNVVTGEVSTVRGKTVIAINGNICSYVIRMRGEGLVWYNGHELMKNIVQAMDKPVVKKPWYKRWFGR